MTAKCILVESGDAGLRAALRLALELDGHAAAEITSAEIAVPGCLDSHHLLILAGAVNGTAIHTLCREVRSRSTIAILVIGDGNCTDVIDALNAGADEYVATPLTMAELMARTRALLRRTVHRKAEEIYLHDRAIDMSAHKIKGPEGQISHLTPKEYLVLQYLVANANKPKTHRDLARTVWNRDGSGDVEYVRIVIQQLRRKLEPNPSRPRYIVTERSVGYRFQIPTEASAAQATA